MSAEPPLPEMYVSLLAHAEAERILDDIAKHAELLAVSLKSGARDYAGEAGADLQVARRFLADAGQRGLQLRYRFGGQTWTDTLMRLPSGQLRLVRVADGARF